MDHVPDDSQHRPWQLLHGVDDAEVWIANTNLELQYFLDNDRNAPLASGQGVCLELELGGTIHVHTTGEGVVLLDVSTEAEWALPALTACGASQHGRGQIWMLPENALVQLMLGLNSLIRATSIVMQHAF